MDAPEPAQSPAKTRLMARGAGRRWWLIGAIGALLAATLVLIGVVVGMGCRANHDAMAVARQPATAPLGVSTPILAPLEAGLARTEARLIELQKQVEAERAARSATEQQVQELSRQLGDVVVKQSSLAEAPRPPSAAPPAGMAVVSPQVTPAIAELVLLKERNRLTAYADEAIATGKRAALQAIVDTLIDPETPHLHLAAQAEFKRVQSYYTFSVSIDPGYVLPVREWFGSSGASSESDLTPAQLGELLLDQNRPWEARLRSAFLLRSSADPATNAILLRALKEDPSLDVAKQAQTTFERRVGRSFRLFDIPAVEAWWQMQEGRRSNDE